MYDVELKDFDLKQIAESGQCFRINEVKENQFVIVAQGKILVVEYMGNQHYKFHCSKQQFERRWYRYFDLGTNYLEIKQKAIGENTTDNLILDAIINAPGMRILRQEPWEVIISFIISQRKSIPAIKNCIEKLCEKYGNHIGEYNEKGYYSFPSPYSIVQGGIEGIKETGVGYRAEYIYEAAQAVINGKLDVVALQNMNYAESFEYLKSIKGIGNKVANCICLYGLHHAEAFPKDVWMDRMITEDYGGEQPQWVNSSIAGIIQQYVFYYKRTLRQRERSSHGK